MPERRARDPWLLATAGLIGLAAFGVHWEWSERGFAGDAMSILLPTVLVPVLALAAIGIVAEVRRARTGLALGAVGVAALVAGTALLTAVVVLNLGGTCGPMPDDVREATWDEPGVAQATAEGIPGATWDGQMYRIDEHPTTIDVGPGDRVHVESYVMDWAEVQAQVNATLGQVMDLGYRDLYVGGKGAVC